MSRNANAFQTYAHITGFLLGIVLHGDVHLSYKEMGRTRGRYQHHLKNTPRFAEAIEVAKRMHKQKTKDNIIEVAPPEIKINVWERIKRFLFYKLG